MNEMQEMKVEKMKKMLPLLTLMALAISGGMVLGAYLLSRSVTSSGVIITSSDFKVYSDASCTTEITSFAFGDMKRGDVVDKVFWIKYVTGKLPEVDAKIKWSKSADGFFSVTAKFYDDAQTTEFDLLPNVLGGHIYSDGDPSPHTAGKYKMTFTVSSSALLDATSTINITFTAVPAT